MTQSNSRISKAVIPAAGLGTRFLPATKEMLPVVDKPAIQYVVEEAVAAGLYDVLMVTCRNKRPVFKGRRYDTGDRSDYLRAIVGLACEREDPGPEFRSRLRQYVTEEM
ncbi:sugar phosphate nucleotidyltransferase [Streptomyces sp. NPDC005547]|uniref:sugar phosphate nucleotidyltransferase n=1 Tax=Streptomyces sp. NPDC005547 TaxID=3154887 RepID=UPI00339DCB79